MCRWLAYSGSPILVSDVLSRERTRRWTRVCTRGSGPSRRTATGSVPGGTALPRPRGSTEASNRRETTTTCTSSQATSVRRCFSPTSAQRSAAPCSGPTATRLTTTSGCSCTTATSTSSARSSVISSSRSIRRCIRRSAARPTRGAVLPRADLRPGGRLSAAVGQAIGLVEDVAERYGVPHPFQGTVATTDGESARGRTRGGCGNDKGKRLKRCEAVELADPVFSADGGLRAPFPWQVRPRSRDEAFAVEAPGARTADSAGPSRSEMGSAEPKKTDGGSCLASVRGAGLLGSRHQRKSASRASHSTGSATSQMALEPWPASRCAGQSVTWAWSGWLEGGNRERPACSPRRAATATIPASCRARSSRSEAVSPLPEAGCSRLSGSTAVGCGRSGGLQSPG